MSGGEKSMEENNMKKLVPALLALLLVLSMMPITVAAAEGTAIKTAADFEAIANDPTGVYYLANDIDFGGKVYEAGYILEDFSGKLDGCGYALFNYTITNGTGDVDVGTVLRLGKTAKDTIEIKNINFGKPDNLVKMIINDAAQGQSEGIVAAAQQNNGVEAVIENVNVYADIKAEMNGKINCAGFIGYSRFVTINKSTMNGNIAVGKPNEPDTVYKNAAGFIASGNDALASLTDCTNNATITTYCSSVEARAAGIVSYTGKTMSLTNCVNNGTITVMDGKEKAASQAAGIIADINGDFVYLKGCVNNGAISASNWCGGIVAYVRKAGVELDSCANYGTYTKDAAKAAAFVATFDEAKAGDVNVMSNCKDETGKAVVTTAPVTTKAPETTQAPETTKAPTTTEAPATTKAPATTPSTADNGVVFMMAAMMAAAACVFMKKRAR